MKISMTTRVVLCILAVAGLASCGGGGSSDEAATAGRTVAGTIAGFGSIIMDNGVEYETDGLSNCEIDDEDVTGVCEDSLSAGMHVTLRTDASGVVTSLKYDDELEGVASNVVVAVGSADGSGDYTFEIYGVTVTTTSPYTQWDDFSPNTPTIAELDGADIEVSGEWLNGGFHASYIELQDDSSHEVKGTVGVVTETPGTPGIPAIAFPLTLRNGTTIDVDASAVPVSELPVEGDFVELKGNYDGIIFTATEIEIEDEDDFDGDSEGEITGTLIMKTSGYSIGNTNVDISSAPSCMGLEGLRVEAEGTYLESGVLLVEKCENEDEDMEAKCQVVDAATVLDASKPKVGSVECGFPGTAGGPLTIKFNDSPGLAMFSDDSTASTFDLTDVIKDDCIEIKFSKDANGDYIAGLIEHEASGGCDSTELEATVDVFNDATDITAAGVTFTANPTVYEPIGSNASLNVGDKVKIKDSDADGNADNIEVDD